MKCITSLLLSSSRTHTFFIIIWNFLYLSIGTATPCSTMSSSRFEPSSIKNKLKREEVSRKTKKAKGQLKLQKRLAQAKAEANDPAAKKVGVLGFCGAYPHNLTETARRERPPHSRQYPRIRPVAAHCGPVFVDTSRDSPGPRRGPLCLVLHVHG
jgi:hypothetical protein